jgi:succinate-semialdehyde dehydrogenase/glutarate-semialdehyde dehydrogenase
MRVGLDKPGLARADLLRESVFIGGAWRDGPSTIAVTNPSTGRVLGTIPDVGGEGAKVAIAAATDALPGWSARTGKERAQILRAWFERIMAQSARSCDFGHVEEQRLNMAIYQARSCPPIS